MSSLPDPDLTPKAPVVAIGTTPSGSRPATPTTSQNASQPATGSPIPSYIPSRPDLLVPTFGASPSPLPAWSHRSPPAGYVSPFSPTVSYGRNLLDQQHGQENRMPTPGRWAIGTAPGTYPGSSIDEGYYSGSYQTPRPPSNAFGQPLGAWSVPLPRQLMPSQQLAHQLQHGVASVPPAFPAQTSYSTQMSFPPQTPLPYQTSFSDPTYFPNHTYFSDLAYFSYQMSMPAQMYPLGQMPYQYTTQTFAPIQGPPPGLTPQPDTPQQPIPGSHIMASAQPLPSQAAMAAPHPLAVLEAPAAQSPQLKRVPPSGPLRYNYFTSLLDKGHTTFNTDELRALYDYLDPSQSWQRVLVHRLATEVPWETRAHKLTIILAYWILSSGHNDQLVIDLLSQRLHIFGEEEWRAMMSLKEAAEEMRVEVILDEVRKGTKEEVTEEEKKEWRARLLARDIWATLME
ncbi:hypothetical protein F5Y06DRAFT_220118 [Hypoxylon sp. FL0890]|nr:hypothetical protein F5Y06DRAFT_220118 [Hypoxylon sp. FL0890]